jgi:hypothetical protein
MTRKDHTPSHRTSFSFASFCSLICTRLCRYEPIQESEPLSLLQAQSLSLVDNFSDDEDEGIEEDQISAKVSSNKIRSNSTRARSMSGMSSPGSTGRPSMDTSIQIHSSESKQPTSPLSWFLIHRACTSKAIATKLYWFLKVETETDINGLFTRNLEALLASLHRSSNENSYLADQLVALDGYLGNITNCQKDARNNLLKPMFAGRHLSPHSLLSICIIIIIIIIYGYG